MHMAFHGGVVPEADGENFIVKKMDRKLHSGANSAAQDHQGEESDPLWREG